MKLRRIDHHEHISVIDHLDELRWRIIISLGAFLIAFIACLWNNQRILDLLNRPLGNQEPITLGVAEPFTTTLSVCMYAGLALSGPIILYHLYAYILPAFSPSAQRVALPLLLMIPVLFIGGIVFGYMVILPQAIHFLQQFNAEIFQTQLRAREYYQFVTQSILAVGVLFQIPAVVLGATRMGIISPESLRTHRRYVILGIAVAAMLLPGQDPVTMVLAMLPLIVLYELSLLLSSIFYKRNTL